MPVGLGADMMKRISRLKKFVKRPQGKEQARDRSKKRERPRTHAKALLAQRESEAKSRRKQNALHFRESGHAAHERANKESASVELDACENSEKKVEAFGVVRVKNVAGWSQKKEQNS